MISLGLNSLNGVMIITAIYNSLKYLDQVYKQITVIDSTDMIKLRKELMESGSKSRDSIKKKKNLDNQTSATHHIQSRGYSRDYTPIEKPMLSISCLIFALILILSGFYLLSLYALGFFS